MLLIAILAVGGAIITKKTPSTINRGTRAVIVPTGDAARTVIVPPCGTGTNTATSNIATLMNTTGTISVTLPMGGGLRDVLIPKCTGAVGGSAGTSNLPSAAFVPRPGAPLPKIGASASSTAGSSLNAQFQLTVPEGSPIRTIVVVPCEQKNPSGSAEEILGVTGSSTTAVAPPC